MANETLLTNIAGLVEDINAEVIYLLNQQAGILQTVRVRDTQGTPGVTVAFPKFGTVSSSDVTQATEGTDHSTNKQITNADVDATIAEHIVMSTISDLSDYGSSIDLTDAITRILVDAVQAKLEDDIVNLYGSFSTNTVAGAGTTMTLDHWFQARQKIKAGRGSMNNLVAVISPKQMWGSKGVSAILASDSDQYGGMLSDEMKRAGFVANLTGIPIYVSNEINEDVSSGGDAAGWIGTRDAIGLHWKGVTVEIERNASLRGYELVAVGRWGEVELVDAWGCYMLSDVS